MAYDGPFPITARDGGTGVSNAAASTITLGGAFTTSGAHTTTLTVTGNTNVTLPTSGTLVAGTVTQYDVLVGGASNVISSIGPGSSGQVLQSGGNAANPAYSTATYPATATGTGTILRADGTNWSATTTTYPNTNAINTLLYASSANVMSALATANNGLLITGTTGIPSILADGTTGQVLTATTGSPPSWANPATSGTVTTVSVATANGFAGTVANASTTPAITLTTSQTGLLSGNGTAITGTAITQYNVITAGASNAPNNVAPSATSGVPLISQGSSAQPIFGTAVVAGGGTGLTTATAYAVLCGGTTGTGAFQSIAGVGTSGQVLTSNGASALPTFQAAASSGFTSITVQVFTSTGNYTPTSGMLYCTIEVVGGGGGGGGTNSTALTAGAGGGGGGGGYARKTVPSATIGSSQTVTIGAGGTAGAAGANSGGTGGTTSVGSIVSATGGVGGGGSTSTTSTSIAGGAGGAGSSGDFNITGQTGGTSFCVYIASSFNFANSGVGGSSVYGTGGSIPSAYSSVAGNAGVLYGGGGSGGVQNNNGGAKAGGAGAAGIIIITEYV
jgi:hypothetical protein